MRRTVPGFLALAVSLLPWGTAAATAASGAPPADEWTDRELRVLASLSLHGIDGPPRDPSNRVADDPRAAGLGERVFFDPELSRNGKVSCATCHVPERYFTDGRRRSKGIGMTGRNTPTVVGSGFLSWFYWDGRRDSLWSQALTPLEAADEMGKSRLAVIRRIFEDEAYLREYRAVFGESPASVEGLPVGAGPLGDGGEKAAWAALPPPTRDSINRTFANLGKSIAAYERTLLPPRTRFDLYVEGVLADGGATPGPRLDPAELAGLRLFLDADRTRCLRCHNGPMLTNGSFHNIGTGNLTGDDLDFGRAFGIRAVLLDEFNCLGPYSDAEPDDCLELKYLNRSPHVPMDGAFKVPSLRNVTATAPYLHDGSMPDLDAVMQHYLRPPEGSGSHELTPLELSDTEIQQLIAFLGTLDAR